MTTQYTAAMEVLFAFDHLNHAIRYLRGRFVLEGDPEAIKADLDAREILLDLEQKLLAEAQEIAGRRIV